VELVNSSYEHQLAYEHQQAYAPDPYRIDLPRVSIDKLMTPQARRKLIAETAYFIAERRGFVPGHELSDWIAAERAVNRACRLTKPSPRWDP
jgi:hypothetical protein